MYHKMNLILPFHLLVNLLSEILLSEFLVKLIKIKKLKLILNFKLTDIRKEQRIAFLLMLANQNF